MNVHRIHIFGLVQGVGFRPFVYRLAHQDGAIWGGEAFVGSVEAGFLRVGHLRYASLPGGDASARQPVQTASGFGADTDVRLDFTAPPFS